MPNDSQERRWPAEPERGPAAPRIGVPPLAGICSLEQAARMGFGVEENVRLLLRYHWAERRIGDIVLAQIPSTPEWEVKGGFALHQWLDAEHADGLRRRISELRHPAPRLDEAPDELLELFFRELGAAEDTLELLAGVYGVARGALLDAYRRHLAGTNPLVDHPTCRLLRAIIEEERQVQEWGRRAVAGLLADGPAAERMAAWQGHLQQLLRAAGGLSGNETRGEPPAELRSEEHALPDTTPRRDSRFGGSHQFDFPPHVVYNLDYVPAAERNLALVCKRLLEMDVPEMMASFLVEDREMPWEHQLAYRRQLWDEARHSMMGEAALEAAGVDWTRIPLNVGFSLRLNRHATPRERELLLYAIEQSLMPREAGKRYEYETARAAGDALSALFHDYDWADEVLHAQIGRRWLRRAGLLDADVLERGRSIHERTWRELDRYRDEPAQPGWWTQFVREVLGTDSAAREEDLRDPEVVRNG